MQKKVIILFTLTIFTLSLFAISSNGFVCNNSNDRIVELEFHIPEYEIVSIEENGETFSKILTHNEIYLNEVSNPEIPVFTSLIAISNKGIISSRIEILDEKIIHLENLTPFRYEPNDDLVKNSDIYGRDILFPEIALKTGEPAIMRDVRMTSVGFSPFQYNDALNELHIIKSAIITIETNPEIRGINELENNSRKVSRAFEDVKKSSLINFDFLTARNSYSQPSILFIYKNNNSTLSNLNILKNWKHQMGYEVHVASTSETGTSKNAIKSYIQNAYDNWENSIDFVVLVGDCSGTYEIPTWYLNFDRYNGEGDHPYALLSGNDQVEDIFIGRLSFTNITDFQTIISKIFLYEKEPYLTNTDWYSKPLLVGDVNPSGISCISVNKYIKEIMTSYNPEFDFTEVYSSPFASSINNALNSGKVFFNYRGYYGVSGWTNSHINSLSNTKKLPVCVIITCDTGSFSGTSRTEELLRAGTPTSPKGGVCAIGASTTGTHTAYNNVVDLGIFQGLFTEDLRTIGEGLQRGKTFLYECYQHSQPSKVETFSHIISLMGDPSLQVFKGEQQEMIVSYQENIAPETDQIEVLVSDSNMQPLSDTWVTLLKGDDDIFATGYTNENGIVFLDANASTLGTATLTATKPGFIAHLGQIEYSISATSINIDDFLIDDDNNGTSIGNGDSIMNPGETIELNIALNNNGGTTLNNVNATLTSLSEFVTITDSEENYGNINSGATINSTDDFDIEISNSCPGNEEIIFNLSISTNISTFNKQFSLPIEGVDFALNGITIIEGGNGIIDPAETAELFFDFLNNGSVTANNINTELSCSDERITIEQASSVFPNINPGANSENTSAFVVTANLQIIPGTQVTFFLNCDYNSTQNQIVSIPMTIGDPQVTDPLGPDSYGYYIYDSNDSGYSTVPFYNWIEIDPSFGGNGTSVGLSDYGNNQDDVEVLDLPFAFTCYGISYDEISICSNGWIGLGATEQVGFRNYRLPGPYGPSPMIAPFWDDFYLGNGDVLTYYDSSEHIYIIEWSNVRLASSSSSHETFEVILYDPIYYPTDSGDGEILIQYKDFNNDDTGSSNAHYEYCTIGIEDHTGLIGLEYTYNNTYPTAAMELEDETAIFITTRQGIQMLPPQAVISAEAFDFILEPGDIGSNEFTIQNNGEQNLFYSIGLSYNSERTNGGPDNFGYSWIDSDDVAGPTYEWRDISGINTTVSFPNNDQGTGLINLDFTFNYYGIDYTQFRINPNGWVGFGDDYTAWTNVSIPSSSAPAPALMPFWDDLNPASSGGGGQVSYYSTSDSLVVWFDSVEHWGSSSSNYDFEIIIYANGEILFQYRDINGENDSATIGIQNASGNDGLEVISNSSYIHDELAISFKAYTQWLSITPSTGIIPSGTTTTVNLVVDTAELELGEYLCNLVLNTNDPNNMSVIIPVNLEVTENALSYGDVDGNGTVQAFDAAITLQYSIGLDPIPTIDPIPWENWRLLTADVDGNGSLQAFDSSLILQYTLGLITSFPVQGTRNDEQIVEDFSITSKDGFINISASNISAINLEISNFSGYTFGEPEILVENVISANNINDGIFKFAVASSEPIRGDKAVEILRIPFKLIDKNSSEITIDLILNTQEQQVVFNPINNSNNDVSFANEVFGNYPNPFNPTTIIKLSAKDDNTSLKVMIYNIKGKLVTNLFSGKIDRGIKEIVWNGIDMNGNATSSGVYFYKIYLDNKISTHKMLLLK